MGDFGSRSFVISFVLRECFELSRRVLVRFALVLAVLVCLGIHPP
jgi:hypothetical protein